MPAKVAVDSNKNPGPSTTLSPDAPTTGAGPQATASSASTQPAPAKKAKGATKRKNPASAGSTATQPSQAKKAKGAKKRKHTEASDADDEDDDGPEKLSPDDPAHFLLLSMTLKLWIRREITEEQIQSGQDSLLQYLNGLIEVCEFFYGNY